jgi:DNA-binding response OmpR family regulator
MKRRLLLVDDELAILLTLKAILELNGFEVETAESAKEAEQKLQSGEYHMVITDMKMEHDRAGYDVIQAAKRTQYDPAVAILTAFPTLTSEWQSHGAESLLVKPVGTRELLLQLEALLIRHEDKKRGKNTKELKSAKSALPPSRRDESTAVKKAV